MSIYGTVDVTVHLTKFINIDLFSRGAYYIRVSVYAEILEDNSLSSSPHSDRQQDLGASRISRVSAIPFVSFSNPSTREHCVGQRFLPAPEDEDSRLERDSTIDGSVFNTKMFIVKYKNEEIDLNEVVQFQFLPVLEAEKRLSVNQPLVLQLDLMFSKLTPNATVELEFEPASTQKFVIKLKGTLGCIHEFLPVTFDDLHFIQLDSMLHVMLVNLKYRKSVYHKERGGENREAKRIGRRGKQLQEKEELVERSLSPAFSMAAGSKRNFLTMLSSFSDASISSQRSSTNTNDLGNSPHGGLRDGVEQRVSDDKLTAIEPPNVYSPSGGHEANIDRKVSGSSELLERSSYAEIFENAAAVRGVLTSPGRQEDSAEVKRRMMYRYFVSPLLDSLEVHCANLRWMEAMVPPAQLPEDTGPVGGDGRTVTQTAMARILTMVLEQGVAQTSYPTLERRFCSAASSPASPKAVLVDCLQKLADGTTDFDDVDLAIAAIERDIHVCAKLCYLEWQSFVACLPSVCDKLVEEMRANWLTQIKQRWACQTFLQHNHYKFGVSGGLGTIGSADDDSRVWGPPAYYTFEEELERDDLDKKLKKGCGDTTAPFQVHVIDLLTFEQAHRLPIALVQRYDQIVGTYAIINSKGDVTPPLPLLKFAKEGKEVTNSEALKRRALKRKAPSVLRLIDQSSNVPAFLAPRMLVMPSLVVAHLSNISKGVGADSVGSEAGNSAFEAANGGLDDSTHLPTETKPTTKQQQQQGMGRNERAMRTGRWGSQPETNPDVAEKENVGVRGEEESGEACDKAPHIIVLQHGFHGSPFDMRMIRNYMRIFLPHCLILNAESNQQDADVSIRVMGQRLADELMEFVVKSKCCVQLFEPDGRGRISFVGHSAGCLIMRAALTQAKLKPLLSKLHAFVSVSGPHLGGLYSSTVIQTGMWAMRKWKKSDILNELSLVDQPKLEDTFVYWLSRQPGLEYFNYVILVSASKDAYVPMHSARIQLCDAAERDALLGLEQGIKVARMVQSLLAPLDKSKVFRMNLYSFLDEANLDTLIGRAAHIGILDSPQLVQLVLCTLHGVLT